MRIYGSLSIFGTFRAVFFADCSSFFVKCFNLSKVIFPNRLDDYQDFIKALVKIFIANLEWFRTEYFRKKAYCGLAPPANFTTFR